MSCALPMDDEAFTRHQARAVIDEVLVPEFDAFVQQTQLASRVIEQISGGRVSGSKGGGGLRWWNPKLVGWTILLVMAGFFVAGLLKQ